MSYKALYRKYRPQLFSEIVGQEAITKTLQNAIISKKISHAYLFCGPRGTGKTTTARIFAKALNCANVNNGEPCTECISCKEISESMSPDVIEIDAASNNGVDEIRDIREKIKFLPSGAKYKIYIIDEVHMLSGGAFNALLKTLEEPPKHVIFILATTEPQKLPATIISRCQRFDFKPLGTYEISEQLKNIAAKEESNITDDAVNAISEAAEGGMRDALSILDQVISYGSKDITLEDVNAITGTVGFDKMNLLANYIANKNVNEALEVITDLSNTGKEANKIVAALLVYFRDLLLYKSVGAKSSGKYIFEKQEFQELAYNLSNSKVLYYINVLCDVQNRIKSSTTPNVYLEIATIKMCNITDEELDLKKRLDALEEKVENADFSEGGSAAPVDNEKVGLLETKVNQVVTEFSKLELHKMAQRIDDLSQIVANRINSSDESNNSDLQKEIEDIKFNIANMKNDALVSCDDTKLSNIEEEIQALKIKVENNPVLNDIENIKGEISALKNSNSFEGEYEDNNEGLEAIKALVEDLKNRVQNQSINESPVSFNEDINSAINDLTKKINDIYEYLDKSNLSQNNNYSEADYDLSEIKEKLETLESRMYKFISSAISNKKEKAKMPEQKNKGQVMLFGDDILSIDDFDKSNKEKVDFDELEMSEEEKAEAANNEVENETFDIEENEVVENSNEETVEEIQESANEENEDLQAEVVQEGEHEIVTDTQEDSYNLFNMEEEAPAQEEQVQQEEPVLEEKQGEQNLFDTEIHKVEAPVEEKPKVKDEVLASYFDSNKNESVVQKTNSTIVHRETVESNDLDIAQSVLRHEVERQEEQAKYIEPNNEEIIVSKQEEKADKFAAYDIKDVEQILFDSQSPEARNDKNRVLEVWASLTRGIQYDLLPIADTLQEGQIVAVGNKELIIVFNNVALCNQVMRYKFKKEALRLLYGKLGDSYNYIALPNDTWLEKRNEYKSQYQIGIKRPKLSPLNIKGLNLVEEQDEYVNKEEKVIKKTIEMFGDDIVKIN